jgi:L-methionine (R)-S-oxide reductase
MVSLLKCSTLDPASTESLTTILDSIRQLASTSASLSALQQQIVTIISQRLPHYDWVGFYMLDANDPDILVLGSFVGEPTPHIRIPVHEGICGAAVATRSTIVVDDVTADPRYLSCSLKTRSEIVVPIFVKDKVVGELDIDSHTPAAFTASGREFLEDAARIVGNYTELHPA